MVGATVVVEAAVVVGLAEVAGELVVVGLWSTWALFAVVATDASPALNEGV